jgi:calcium-dependent protein kinase
MFMRGQKFIELVGSPYYMAPEILKKQGYDERVDIWSVGVIFFILLMDRAPFDGVTDLEVLHGIQKMKINFGGKEFKKKGYVAIDLLKRMMAIEPDSRISISDAWNHNYFDEDAVDFAHYLHSLKKYKLFKDVNNC